MAPSGLTQLRLEDDDDEHETDQDNTRAVAGILAQNHSNLFINKGYPLQARLLWQAIQSRGIQRCHIETDQPNLFDDSALEACLEMLRHQKTTLQECQPWSRRDSTGRIQYHLNLNRFGRGTLQFAKSLEALVDLLQEVENQDNWKQPVKEEDSVSMAAPMLDLSVQQVNVIYGLLQESPHVWCL